jgi:hypothetical protein
LNFSRRTGLGSDTPGLVELRESYPMIMIEP